jgi:hypothetical protein
LRVAVSSASSPANTKSFGKIVNFCTLAAFETASYVAAQNQSRAVALVQYPYAH